MGTRTAVARSRRARTSVREDDSPPRFSRAHEADAIKRQLEALAIQARKLGFEGEAHLIGVAALSMSDALDP